MSKELPYFQFFINEWMNDDISFASYKIKGVFTDLCAWYWFKDCSITKAQLEQRFSTAKKEIQYLFDNQLIKTTDTNFLSIRFLDNQYDELSERRKKKQEAGSLGGLAKAKHSSSTATAPLQHTSSNIDKDKEIDKKKTRERVKRFTPPALSDVCNYMIEKGMTSGIESTSQSMKFIDHYTSNGWMIGKNKMKDWQAAVRSNWLKDISSQNGSEFTYQEMIRIHNDQKDQRTQENFEAVNPGMNGTKWKIK